jgi:hypothetical protein
METGPQRQQPACPHTKRSETAVKPGDETTQPVAAAVSGAAEAGSPGAPDACALRAAPPASAETLDTVLRTGAVAEGALTGGTLSCGTAEPAGCGGRMAAVPASGWASNTPRTAATIPSPHPVWSPWRL